jgi:hypothetical protein
MQSSALKDAAPWHKSGCKKLQSALGRPQKWKKTILSMQAACIIRERPHSLWLGKPRILPKRL